MGALVTLLIGHRGAGKSTLLKQFLARHPQCRGYDLDEEIAHSTGETVDAIFARGESEFRNHERRVLDELIHSAPGPLWIAVGAGFAGPIPTEAHVIWIRRATDRSGRVFADRPRLNAAVSPYLEYMQRFSVRERRYRDWAHEVITLPEGGDGEMADFLCVTGPKWKVPYDLTIVPENFHNWSSFWGKRNSWELRKLELRDDLLSRAQIDQILESVPAVRLLYSTRSLDPSVMPTEGLDFDWPLEMGEPRATPAVLSLHERSSDLESLLRRFQSGGEVLKLAIEIRDFYELKKGHSWWLQDPSRRAFLPRSADGRWRWYRSLFGPRMPVHYIREGEGSSLDQPYLWQSELQMPLHKHFAAVLGSPVEHSRTPMEHRSFFAERGMPVVAIDVNEAEFPEAMAILRDLGLKYAAVTAPLKKAAVGICSNLSSEAHAVRSVNTLFHDGRAWSGHNTDVLALQKVAASFSGDISPEKLAATSVWLWGGGGVKSSVKRVWPQAREISARSGTRIEENPDLIIWATGRTREFKWPPDHVKPKLVLDLNYGEASPGLEWAVQRGFPYQSGLRMFKLQAEAQRRYWRDL